MSSTADPPALAAPLAWLDTTIHETVAAIAATEPSASDPFRGLYISDSSAVRDSTHLEGGALDDRVRALADALELDALDTAILAVCAAPELDARYGRLIAYLHDDVARTLPSARLIVRLLAAGGVPAADLLARLAVDAPLRHGGVIRMEPADPAPPIADRGLRLDERVVAELLGATLVARPALRLVSPNGDPGRQALVAQLARAWASPHDVYLACVGPDAEQVLAHAVGRPLVVLSAEGLRDPEAVAQARLHARLADQAALVVSGMTALEPAALDECLRGLEAAQDLRLVIDERDVRPTLGQRFAVHQVEVPSLTTAERRRMWSGHLGGAAVGEVAERFALSAAEIERGAAVARLRAAARDGGADPDAGDLLGAGREVSHGALGGLATRLEPGPTWEALILPEHELAMLRSITAFVRHREQVLDRWGFGRQLTARTGPTALFAGDSGTGKTLAARVVASDLGLEAYRIDLAGVVSKYIGETEKNLDRIFTAAAGGNGILIFDEADALFGKRSAVSDARDRYANLEVAYLLQRLETYDGPVILTTNLRHNIDTAFLRRIDFTVDFPLPDEAARRDLWARHLPPEAPQLDLDLADLALVHQITGGSIATCARHAAFAAAEAGEAITMDRLDSAIALELRKLGRLAASPT